MARLQPCHLRLDKDQISSPRAGSTSALGDLPSPDGAARDSARKAFETWHSRRPFHGITPSPAESASAVGKPRLQPWHRSSQKVNSNRRERARSPSTTRFAPTNRHPQREQSAKPTSMPHRNRLFYSDNLTVLRERVAALSRSRQSHRIVQLLRYAKASALAFEAR